MQLSSSPEQQAALEELLAGQHDAASPHFQEWLTPEQFGERFGPAQQDIDAVVAWLQDNGFRVDEIGRGRRTLEFSGTASQVEQAFHTEMHQYDVAGVRHLANSMDLAVPEALAPVIAGVAGLHDFRQPADAPRARPGGVCPSLQSQRRHSRDQPVRFCRHLQRDAALEYPVRRHRTIRRHRRAHQHQAQRRCHISLYFRPTLEQPASDPQRPRPRNCERGRRDGSGSRRGMVRRGGQGRGHQVRGVREYQRVGRRRSFQPVHRQQQPGPGDEREFRRLRSRDGRGQPVLQLAVAAGRRTGHLRLRLDGGLRFRGLRQPRRAHSGQPWPRGQRPGFDAVQRRRRRHPVRRYGQPRHVVERGQRCEQRFRQGLHPGNRMEREFLHFRQRQRQQSLCGQRRRELALHHAGVAVRQGCAGERSRCRRPAPSLSAGRFAGGRRARRLPGVSRRKPLYGGRNVGLLARVRRADGDRRSIHGRPQRQPEHALLFAGRSGGPRPTTMSPAAPSRCPAQPARRDVPRPRSPALSAS